jgi:uncharacterized protein DUF5662
MSSDKIADFSRKGRDTADILKRIDSIRRHIKNVQDAAELLAHRLIEKGEVDFAINLLANVMVHDQSKYKGIEFQSLNTFEEDKELFALALKQHWSTNQHHPEYWGEISGMPRIYIAEMICDLKARSEEFGTNLREYIKGEFAEKHKLTARCRPMIYINYFLDLLLDKPFKKTTLPER